MTRFSEQNFARREIEVLGIDESGGYVGDIGDGGEDDEEIERCRERSAAREVGPVRQILLVIRKGERAGN